MLGHIDCVSNDFTATICEDQSQAREVVVGPPRVQPTFQGAIPVNCAHYDCF